MVVNPVCGMITDENTSQFKSKVNGNEVHLAVVFMARPRLLYDHLHVHGPLILNTVRSVSTLSVLV
jgi:hypothetical protein